MNEGLRAGYKRTEVGVIPAAWSVRTIGEMFRLKNGCAFKPEDWKQSGTPIIRIQNLNDPYASFNYSQAPVAEANRVEAGDLLFAWSGTIGTSFGARLWTGPTGVLNQHIFKVLMDEDEITLPFSQLVFARVEEDIAKQAHGFKASFVHIKKSDLIKVCLPVPALPEQRAIAAALGDVDALLGGLDSLIAKKQGLKVAAMQQLLTGQTRLPGFAGEWEVKRLGDAGKCLRGVSYKGDGDLSAHDTPATRRLLRSSNVQNATLVIDDVQFVNAARVSEHQILKRNDILICMANGSKALVGKAGVFNISNGYEYTFGAFMGCFRSESTEANQTFLFYLFQTGRYRDYIGNLLAGSSINNLRPSSIESLEFAMPPVSEQTAIATILSDMDAELAALEARRDKTRNLKQAMMQELLTGRTRLVEPASNVIPVDFSAKPAPPVSDQPPAAKAHNWAIHEAVVVAVLVKQFGSEQRPLGRKRYTKLAYLMHRHVERVALGYLKKAAGPYNPAVKYRGPEGIAQKNGYIRTLANGKFSGFVAAEKVAQAEGYFEKWYGPDVRAWLEQFHYKSTEELELLATVDMAAEDLRRAGRPVNVNAVKSVIHDNPEWEAKLERAIFSDANITRAIAQTRELFQ